MGDLERRATPRVQLAGAVLLVRQGGEELSCEADNLSAEGVALRCAGRPPYKGERVTVEIPLDDGQPGLVAAAEVVYVIELTHPESAFRMGLHFVNLDVASQTRVDAYIGTRLGGRDGGVDRTLDL